MEAKSIYINKDYLYKFILLLCGFFVFSGISSVITLEYFKLPLALPELLFLPFYFYLRKRIDFRINKRDFLIGLYFILIFIGISLLVNNFGFSAILSTARGYLYILFVFSIFKNKEIKDYLFIMYIAYGSVIGWLFQSILFLNKFINNPSGDVTLAVYGNMIALSLIISIPIILKKYKYIYLSFLLGIMLSITTGIRRQILVLVFTYILSILLSFNYVNKYSKFKIIFVLIIVLSSMIYLYPKIDNYVYNTSPILHHRIIEKTEQFFQGDLSSEDKIRSNSFNDFYNDFFKNILPRGFVSHRSLTDAGAGLYMDSPYVELFYTFSIIGCFLFLIFFIRYIIFHFKNYYRFDVDESAICLVSIGAIFVLIIVEGTFINFPYSTPFTGFILGRIFSKKKLWTLNKR